jgi:hypothetical protein
VPLIPRLTNSPAATSGRRHAIGSWLCIAHNQLGQEDGDSSYIPLNPGVDPGEANAIGYARQQTAAGLSVLLLIDDRCGRADARPQGLNMLGTAAVLVLAKEHGLVASCAPLLEQLRANGYDLSDNLVAAVLEQAGVNCDTHSLHPPRPRRRGGAP